MFGKRFARALLASGVALSACSAPAMNSSPGIPPQAHALAGSSGRVPTSMSFKFQTVDDSGSTVNAVAGINNASEIVGNIGAGTGSSPMESYYSTPPYSSFTPVEDSKAADTVATSLDNSPSNQMQAGYIINPPQLTGTWGFVRVNGIFTLIKDRKEGTGNNAVTKILGINDQQFGVGYFVSPTGVKLPFEVSIPSQKFVVLKCPGAKNAAATGINNAGDIAGWYSTGSETDGFFERVGVYYDLEDPGAAGVTVANAVNAHDDIVGYYLDSSNVKHGFIVTDPQGGSQQVWQTIDEPDAANGTVITGVNDSDDISGYYVDSGGVQHGFVAVKQ
jgi:hypothetical protein